MRQSKPFLHTHPHCPPPRRSDVKSSPCQPIKRETQLRKLGRSRSLSWRPKPVARHSRSRSRSVLWLRLQPGTIAGHSFVSIQAVHQSQPLGYCLSARGVGASGDHRAWTSEALPRARSMLRATFAQCLVVRSHSQIRTTRQPCLRRVLVTRRSLARLRSSFDAHQSARFFGRGACFGFGQPCQKQPSTNTATRSRRNTKSGLPKRD